MEKLLYKLSIIYGINNTKKFLILYSNREVGNNINLTPTLIHPQTHRIPPKKIILFDYGFNKKYDEYVNFIISII